jgi:hypothetical protein
MVNLKKALAASALAVGLLIPGALGVAADEGEGSQTTATCPTTSQTFPFVLPAGLVPGLGGSGSLVLSAETGQNGVCSGTFTAFVGGAPIATGSFTAFHSGSTVTVFFQTSAASAIGARGVLYFNSATGHGFVATKITAGGQCAYVIAQFTGPPASSTFTIVGTPLVFPCF